MSEAVPRGTELVNWQADLAAREADTAGDSAYFDQLRADRRDHANPRFLSDGLAHIDRLAVDGGALTGGRANPHRPLRQALGACALAALILAVVYGGFLLAWAGE